jgi:hypothetical protein
MGFVMTLSRPVASAFPSETEILLNTKCYMFRSMLPSSLIDIHSLNTTFLSVPEWSNRVKHVALFYLIDLLSSKEIYIFTINLLITIE